MLSPEKNGVLVEIGRIREWLEGRLPSIGPLYGGHFAQAEMFAREGNGKAVLDALDRVTRQVVRLPPEVKDEEEDWLEGFSG